MPPDYVTGLLPVGALGTVGIVAGIVWGVRMLARLRAATLPWFAWVREFRADWSGVAARPGHERQAGIPERMSSLEAAVPGMTVGLAAVEAVQREHSETLANNVHAVALSVRAVDDVAKAVAEVRYNVKPNSGGSAHDQLRELMVQALQELASLRTEFNAALAHNHPDYEYEPDLRADRNID